MIGIESSRPSDRRAGAADASVIIIAVLLVVASLWLGRTVLVPVALAMVMATVLWPVVHLLRRLRVPSPAAATIVVATTLALLVGVGTALEQPVRGLATDLPRSIATARASFGELTARIRSVMGGRATARTGSGGGASRSSTSATKGADSARSDGVPTIEPTGAIRSAFGPTTSLLVEIVEEVLLVLFMLAAGNAWMSKLARIARSPERAARWTAIAGEMHDVVSRYLLVTLLINIGQAILIGLAVWIAGLPSPALWGVLTFLAEFIPYLGGLTMVALLLLAGLAGGEGLAHAVLAPAMYLVVTTLQNNLISPVAYGRGLRLNPTAILIAVMFWWLIWGVAGAFLAVPILASLRVLGSHVPKLTPLCVLLEE